MKKTLFLALALLLSGASFAQEEERQLSAIFSYATFNTLEGQPYLETYFDFDGNSLVYVPTGVRVMNATVEMVMTVSRRDTIVYAKKYNLNSPVAAIAQIEDYRDYDLPDFIDMQRIALPNGEYTLNVTLRDVNAQHKPVEVVESFRIHFGDKPQLSSVQPMASATRTKTTSVLSRGGYDMKPYVNDYYPASVNSLNFYYEIYHIDAEVGKEDFLTVAYVERQETGARYEGYSVVKRQKSRSLVPVYGAIDIAQLPSGNYNLVVEARTKDDALMLYHKVPFKRSNPSAPQDNLSAFIGAFAAQITDESLMNYYLAALYPIANAKEDRTAEELSKTPGCMEQKQAFFYQFWLDRDPINPEGRWREYRQRLDYVDEHFSWAKRRGYLTDMGRVYLQYGKPDHIRDEKNFVSTKHMGAGNIAYGGSGSQGHVYYLPYQLWRYNQLPGDDINRCFIFWDEQRSGLYLLLNSNAKGEVRDPMWERRLCQQQLNEDVVGEVGEQFNRGY